MIRRRTCKKKFRAALAGMKHWIKEARNWRLRMILSSLRLKLRGYWNYYSVLGNSTMTWLTERDRPGSWCSWSGWKTFASGITWRLGAIECPPRADPNTRHR